MANEDSLTSNAGLNIDDKGSSTTRWCSSKREMEGTTYREGIHMILHFCLNMIYCRLPRISNNETIIDFVLINKIRG